MTLTDILFDEIRDALGLVTADGRLVRANAEWIRAVPQSRNGRGQVSLAIPADTRARVLEMRARGGEGSSKITCSIGRKVFEEHIAPVELEGETCFLVTLRELPQSRTEDGVPNSALKEEVGFQLFLDSVKDYAIFMLDPRGHVATWNSGAERIKGYRPEEIIGSHFSRFYLPEQAARGRPDEELRIALEAGRFEDEGWRVRKDGSRFFANVIISKVTDGSGQLLGFAKVTRDLTGKRREEELSTEKERLAVTLRSIGDAVIATDQQGRVTVLNLAAEALTGWRAEAAMGRPLGEIFRIVDEATREPAPNPVDRILRDGLVVGLAHHSILLGRDGTERPISGSGAPILDSGGKVSGVVLVFRDQTFERRTREHLRQSEERYRQLFHNMLDGFAYCRIVNDEEGRPRDFVYLEVNEAFEKLTGLSDVVGKRASEVIPGVWQDHPELLETYGRVAATGIPSEFELVFRPLGIWLSISAYCPRPGHFVSVFDNISERKRVEEALRAELALQDQISKIAASVPGVICSYRLRPDGTACMPFATAAIEELYGVPQKVLAEDMGPCLARIHPDDLEHVQKKIQDSARTLSRWHDEFRYLHPTKGLRFIEGWSSPFVEPGGSILWHGYVFDITVRRRAEEERKESERRLRLHIESTPVAVVEFDTALRITAWNAAAEALFGWTAEEALGQSSSIMVPQRARAHVDEVMRQLLARKGGTRNVNENLTKDGRIVLCDWLNTSLASADGTVIGIASMALDITERDRNARALRESEGRFRALFEQAAVGMAEIEMPSGRFARVNDKLCSILGYSREEMMQLGWQELTHPDDLAHLRTAQASMISSHETYSCEKRYIRKDGATVWASVAVAPLWSRGETPTTSVSVVQDVSRRKAAEDALERRERHLKTIVHTALDGFYVVDMQGRIVEVNDIYCAMSGYTQDELLHMRVSDLEAAEESEDVLVHIEKIRRTGQDRFQSRHRRKDGRLYDIEASVKFIEQEAGAFVCFVRDITEHKRADVALRQSEERFRALIEKSSDMLVTLDAEGRCQFWSGSAVEHLGWTPEERLGRPSLEGVHPEDRERVGKILRRLLTAPGEVAQEALRYEHKDGSWRQLEVTARNLLHDPAVRGVVLNSRDVTNQRLLEQQLQQAQKLESVGRLAGGVAHDFNNLLTVILSCSDALGEDIERGASVNGEDVKQIQAAGERARDLTGQLLAFARKQVIAPVTLDLNDVVQGSKKMLDRLLGEDVVLEVDLEPGLWSMHADPGQLQQVVLNLAVNARDAMPRGGRLTLETRNVSHGAEEVARDSGHQPGDFIRLLIRDSGAGMTAEVKAHLFEPFFTTKEQGKGTGLGLATVYGIVKQASGYVRVESEPGRGSTFEIYFPRHESVPTPLPREPSRAVPRGSETILVAEDNAQVRNVIARGLRGAGYRVLLAASGAEALELLGQETGTVHLLITDVVMPGLDGRGLAEELRRRRPGVRVLYVSGYTHDILGHHGVLDTSVELLAKPFTTSSLLERVRSVLDA